MSDTTMSDVTKTDANPVQRQPAQITPPQTPGLRSLLALATGVVVIAALYLAREVLVPITLAIL
ncbi:MAG: hypothetical protein INR63_21165, partial [Actinomycetospora chiangmaiensis]|nr:hypothetical protein [Actinomycetospora chiangmaiensis]